MQNPLLLNGKIAGGAYAWVGHELFAATNDQSNNPIVGAVADYQAG